MKQKEIRKLNQYKAQIFTEENKPSNDKQSIKQETYNLFDLNISETVSQPVIN